MIAKFNILRSIGKVGAKPREGKTVNAKIRVESIQQYSVVNSAEGCREVEADHDDVVTISIYVGNILLKM